MRVRTSVHVVAAIAIIGVAAVSFHRTAAADGTILTENATITAGGNTTVRVEIDACAPLTPRPVFPPVGTIAPQGTFSTPLPALPDAGDGADGAFSTTTDLLSEPGGTYEYTSYSIRDGATVNYSGAVTLRVQGDVLIEGRLRSASSGASVTVIAGGSVTVLGTNGAPVTGIDTGGDLSPIRVEAGERIEIGTTLSPISAVSEPDYQSQVVAQIGDVTMRAHGVSPSQSSGIEIASARIADGVGGLTLGAAEGVLLSGVDTNARGANLLMQAFDGDLEISDAQISTFVGIGRLESGGGIDVANGSSVEVSAGELSAHAFGGEVRIRNESRLAADDGTAIGVDSAGDGLVDVSASTAVRFSNVGAVEAFGSGGIRVTAHDGSVTLEANGGVNSSYLEESKRGPIEVRASEDVFLGGFSYIAAEDGPVEIRALDSFLQEGETFVSSNAAIVDARAGNAIEAVSFQEEDTQAPNPYFEGRVLLLVAGDGGINLEVDFLSSTEGEISLVADGDIRVSSINDVHSTAEIEIRTLDGSIDVSGVGFETSPYSDSGSVLFESFGGSSAVIDARFASIRTNPGFSTGPGDVTMLVHAGGGVDSFVLPKTAKLRVNAKKPEKSSLRVAGFFDTGVDPVALAGPATIWIGETSIAAELVPKKRNFEFKNDSMKFKIRPTRSGSSRAKFSLLLKGDVAGLIDPDGPLTLRFDTASADGSGSVILEKGSYKLGRKSGLLVTPNLFPFKLKATHKGPGKDSLAFQAGLSTEVGAPDEIPEVTISYGDTLTFVVPGGEFTRKGDNFVAKAPPSAPEISKLNINFKREKIDLKAKGLDLGALPAEAGPVTLTISIGDVAGSVSVRVAPVPKRGQAKY